MNYSNKNRISQLNTKFIVCQWEQREEFILFWKELQEKAKEENEMRVELTYNLRTSNNTLGNE